MFFNLLGLSLQLCIAEFLSLSAIDFLGWVVLSSERGVMYIIRYLAASVACPHFILIAFIGMTT